VKCRYAIIQINKQNGIAVILPTNHLQCV